MKITRGFRGNDPRRTETAAERSGSPSADRVATPTYAPATPVGGALHREPASDDIEIVAKEIVEQRRFVAKVSAVGRLDAAAAAVTTAEPISAADVDALIARLKDAPEAVARQTAPALELLRRLKRLMELVERRRNSYRPNAPSQPGRTGLRATLDRTGKGRLQ